MPAEKQGRKKAKRKWCLKGSVKRKTERYRDKKYRKADITGIPFERVRKRNTNGFPFKGNTGVPILNDTKCKEMNGAHRKDQGRPVKGKRKEGGRKGAGSIK